MSSVIFHHFMTVFEAGWLTEPKAYHFGQVGQSAHSGTHLSLPKSGVTGIHVMFNFQVGDGDLAQIVFAFTANIITPCNNLPRPDDKFFLDIDMN